MSIGIGQILVILVVLLLLFGNVPSLMKDIAVGIRGFKSALKDKGEVKDSSSK